MLWGHKWKGKTVRALCDNMAIVHVALLHLSKSSFHCLKHIRLYIQMDGLSYSLIQTKPDLSSGM